MSEEEAPDPAGEQPPELKTVTVWTIGFSDGSRITVAVHAPTTGEDEQDLASAHFYQHLLDRLKLIDAIKDLPTKRNKLNTRPINTSEGY